MSQSDSKNRGEGDREADRNYREKTREFVKSGAVPEAKKKARDQDPREAEEAERKGKSKAKELDPEVHRDYDEPEKPA